MSNRAIRIVPHKYTKPSSSQLHNHHEAVSFESSFLYQTCILYLEHRTPNAECLTFVCLLAVVGFLFLFLFFHFISLNDHWTCIAVSLHSYHFVIHFILFIFFPFLSAFQYISVIVRCSYCQVQQRLYRVHVYMNHFGAGNFIYFSLLLINYTANIVMCDV